MNGAPESSPPAFDGSRASLAELSFLSARGDERAFAALHKRVGAGLRRMLLKRTGGRDDVAEELSQNTWAAVWKALKENKYDPGRAAITTFVYAVGHNAWLTHLRRVARDQHSGAAALGSDVVGDVSETGGLGGSPTRERGATALLAEAELIEAVRACIRDPRVAGLSELERTIVHAIALGEGDRQLARRLGMSGSTINKHKHNAYAKIRAHLSTRGFSEQPGAAPSGESARDRSDQDIGGAK